MKYLTLLTLLLSLPANSVMDDENLYVNELNAEVHKAHYMKPYLIKVAAKIAPKKTELKNIFSLNEFKKLSQNKLSF